MSNIITVVKMVLRAESHDRLACAQSDARILEMFSKHKIEMVGAGYSSKKVRDASVIDS